MRKKFFLGEVAEFVIRANKPYYYKPGFQLLDNEYEFTEIIPDDILETIFTRETAIELGSRIDELRFQKQNELKTTLSIDDDQLKEIINAPLGSLPEELEEKRKEIKFLFNVACALLHWLP